MDISLVCMFSITDHNTINIPLYTELITRLVTPIARSSLFTSAVKEPSMFSELKKDFHNDARWVTTDELKSYDLAPADIEIIKLIDF